LVRVEQEQAVEAPLEAMVPIVSFHLLPQLAAVVAAAQD
tara:strand:+ start:214 stop:330 length:117 start_codon:yes stop_codon:yes gene_type:complete